MPPSNVSSHAVLAFFYMVFTEINNNNELERPLFTCFVTCASARYNEGFNHHNWTEGTSHNVYEASITFKTLRFFYENRFNDPVLNNIIET